jgi:3',5'-nucleoside bisphosphate phosphatase
MELNGKQGHMHLHTTASDGLITIEDIIEQKLDFVAITDHDTMANVGVFSEKLMPHGIKVVPGVELSTSHLGKDIHVLVYNPLQTKEFIEMMKETENSRYVRANKMVSILEEYGFVMGREFIERKKGVLSKANITKEVLSHEKNKTILEKEGITTWKDFIKNYLEKGKPAYVSFERIGLCDYLGHTEGVKVLAHPYVDLKMGQDDNVIESLVNDFGFGGIETNTRKHSDEQRKYAENLAEKLGVIKTTSGDCHRKMELENFREDYSTMEKLLNSYQ